MRMNSLFWKRRSTYEASCLKFLRVWGCGEDHDRLMQVPNEHLQLPFLDIPTKQPQPNANMNSVKIFDEKYIPVRIAHT